jgi:hypothetical protein
MKDPNQSRIDNFGDIAKVAWETVQKFFNFGEGSTVHESHSFGGEGVVYWARFNDYVSLVFNTYGVEDKWSAEIHMRGFQVFSDGDTPEDAIRECLQDIAFLLEERIQDYDARIKEDRMAIDSIRDQIARSFCAL